MVNKAAKYVSEVKIEMSKVVWPTRGELRESSVIVIMLSLLLALFVFIIDFGLNNILKIIL